MRARAPASDGPMKKLVLCLVLVSGCNGPGGAIDSGALPMGDSGVDAGPGNDAAPSDDASVPGNDAASAVCMPTAGTATVTTGCDLFQLAVIDHDGAPSELVLTGRIYGIGGVMGECAVIDGVDIVSSSATSA